MYLAKVYVNFRLHLYLYVSVHSQVTATETCVPALSTLSSLVMMAYCGIACKAHIRGGEESIVHLRLVLFYIYHSYIVLYCHEFQSNDSITFQRTRDKMISLWFEVL